jgi:hypothetical protein
VYVVHDGRKEKKNGIQRKAERITPGISKGVRKGMTEGDTKPTGKRNMKRDSLPEDWNEDEALELRQKSTDA